MLKKAYISLDEDAGRIRSYAFSYVLLTYFLTISSYIYLQIREVITEYE